MTPAPRFAPAKLLMAFLFGAGLAASAVTIALNHSASSATTFTAAAAQASPPAAPGHGGGHRGAGPRFGGDFSPFQVLGIITKDTGLTPMQILTGLRGGKTLDEITGSNAGKVKTDLLAQLRTELDKAVAKGVFTGIQEQHLMADAGDALDQVFAAHLGAAGLGGLGGPGHEPAMTPSPKPAA